jgi:Domain of unknown function (DUF4177)
MERWEYRVVSFPRGRYTEKLNEYASDGWELVDVVSETAAAQVREQGRARLPMPRALGRLEDAAAKLNKIGADESPGAEADTAANVLLWILRRPLSED